MKEMDEQVLDELIRGHVAARLDPHVGKAVQAFEEMVASGDGSTNIETRSPAFWARATGSIMGLAASLAVAWIAVALYQEGKPPAIVIEPPKGTSMLAATMASLVELERTVSWQTFDEGTVVLEDNTPARKIRRKSVQQIQWYDPNDQTIIETTSPHEEVIFIGLTRS